jgi:hypothetical protein
MDLTNILQYLPDPEACEEDCIVQDAKTGHVVFAGPDPECLDWVAAHPRGPLLFRIVRVRDGAVIA